MHTEFLIACVREWRPVGRPSSKYESNITMDLRG